MASPPALQVIDTQLHADSVEWCPFPGMQDILLCGTYQLLESTGPDQESDQPQVRVGQLQVYQLAQCTEDDDGPPSLSQRHSIDMPGILDIKWATQSPHTPATCGLVNAQGQFQLWKMGEAGAREGGARGKTSLECVAKQTIADECIGLSLDWAGPCEGCAPRVVNSDSKGGLTVMEIESTVTTVSQWCAHDFEAWICAFDRWNKDVIYSGSDDLKLKAWDLRVGTTPVSTNSRFTMGVCSIQSHPLRQHLLAVGSYDENLRVFDTRQMRQPLSTTALGGGVWRVKWEPVSARYILTATMHNGFHIVDCSQPESETLPIVAHYTNHGSLAYGVDWSRVKTTPTTTHGSGEACDVASCTFLVASCSFYDDSLQLWRWNESQR